jgi:hypothetical protein
MARDDNQYAKPRGTRKLVVASAADIGPALAQQFGDDPSGVGFQEAALEYAHHNTHRGKRSRKAFAGDPPSEFATVERGGCDRARLPAPHAPAISRITALKVAFSDAVTMLGSIPTPCSTPPLASWIST